jgi:hypothetical protein
MRYSDTMILADVETWPAPLRDYLASEFQMLFAYARRERETMDAYLNQKGPHVPMGLMPSNPHFHAHESASIKALELARPAAIRGWHCTRLTDHEVDRIKSEGMRPPDLEFLRNRIRRVEADGLVDSRIAERLIAENQANDNNRKGKMWFCFFEPRIAGQSGIERFFRRWGGEALYNSHEDDRETGEALKLVGRPCLIQADVRVSSLSQYTYLGEKILRRYLFSHGFDTGEDCEHEDYAREPIAASEIVRFVFHGEPAFAALTDCDSWTPPLSA